MFKASKLRQIWRDIAFILFLGICIWITIHNGCFSVCDSRKSLCIPELLMFCCENRGFSPATFISLATGLNIALAKWEPFKKSLLDVDGQFKVEFDSEIARRKDAHLVVDDKLGYERMIRQMCNEKLTLILTDNGRTWQLARRWAVTLCVTGFVLLFLRASAGAWGGLLVLPTLVTIVSVEQSKRRIRKLIATKHDGYHSTMIATQELNQQEYKESIMTALTSAESTNPKSDVNRPPTT